MDYFDKRGRKRTFIYSHQNIGKKRSIEQKRTISLGHIGQVAWNKGIEQPENVKLKISESLKKSPLKQSKEKHHGWKGGVTPKQRLIRDSVVYTTWREAIFKKNDYTCLKCKEKGGRLNAHHITNFASIFEKEDAILYDLKNGITFCRKCHNLFHKIYGKKNNTREQLNEFLI